MLKMPVLIGMVIVLIFSTLGLVSCGRRSTFQHGSPEKRAEWIVRRITDELDLDESQKAKLQEIKEEILAKRREFSGAREEFHDAFMKELRSEAVDQETLNELFEEKEVQFKEMRTFMIAKFAEFHSILTPSQKSKLLEKAQKFRHRWHRG